MKENNGEGRENMLGVVVKDRDCSGGGEKKYGVGDDGDKRMKTEMSLSEKTEYKMKRF